MTPISPGAYGFQLLYADPGEHLDDLIDVGPSAPTVTVAWRHASTIVDIEEVSETSVAYGHRYATTFWVKRDPASVVFDLPFPPAPGALVHPHLTVGISVHARWRGDVTLHAGAFETPAGGWAIMGNREAGKSAMLAALAARGIPVVADDLLAIQGTDIWAGPDCVDLRPDTAERFNARYLGMVGGRPRYRMSTPPSRPRLPLRGIFVLDWHEEDEALVEPLSSSERLRWLYRQEYIRLVGYPDPAKLIPLVGLPTWRIARPPDWSVTDRVLDRLLSVTRSI